MEEERKKTEEEVDFQKIYFCSNNEDNFIQIDEEEIQVLDYQS